MINHFHRSPNHPATKLDMFKREDLGPLLQIYKDPETMQYLGGPQTKEQTESAIKKAIQHHEKHGFGPLAIRCAEDVNGSLLVGRTGLRVSESQEKVDLFDLDGSESSLVLKEKVQIGWVIKSSHRGRGVATKTANSVLDHGFRCLGLTEICAFIQIENYASIKVAERLNMQLIGSFVFDGHLWQYHSISKAAYLAQ